MDKAKYLNAVDVVCLDCICGNDEVCESCPVRKTVDWIHGRRENVSLSSLLGEDETLANLYTTANGTNWGYVPVQLIVPKDTPADRLDISACLEETLHRLMDHNIPEAIITELTGFQKQESVNEDEPRTEIDLGWVLPGEMLKFELLKRWTVPVTWEMNGEVEVFAPTLHKAIEDVEEGVFNLPSDGRYVDDSWRVFPYDVESIREDYNSNQTD